MEAAGFGKYLAQIMKRYLQKFLKSNHILQFGLPRSGSTLVFNILRELFPKHQIEKCHTLDNRYLDSTIVATYRNPVDIVASLLLVESETVSDEKIREKSVLLNKLGIWDLLTIRERSNLLLLRYEDFVDDYNVLYDRIEGHFGITISAVRRQELSAQYCRESVKTMTCNYEDFSRYDAKTQFHGRHISGYNGSPGFSIRQFSPGQWNKVACYFSLFMEEMGYAVEFNPIASTEAPLSS